MVGKQTATQKEDSLVVKTQGDMYRQTASGIAYISRCYEKRIKAYKRVAGLECVKPMSISSGYKIPLTPEIRPGDIGGIRMHAQQTRRQSSSVS